MALENENGGGIPATMLVGPATLGATGQAMPYYPMPYYPMPMGGGQGGGSGMGNGWGDGAWIILLIIVLLAAGGGWGNNNAGNGGGFGGGAPIVINDGNNSGYAVQRGFDQAAIMSGVGAIQSGISALSTQLCGCCCDMQNIVNQGFSNVQQSLCSGFAGVNATVNSAQNALAQQMYSNQIADMQQNFAAQTATMQGFNGVQTQLAQCCCDNKAGLADVRYTIATEECATRNNSTQNTRDIIESQTRGTQAILDKLCQLELDGVKQNYENRIAGLQNALDQSRSDNQGLRFAASQTAQNAFIAQGLNNEVDSLYTRLSQCPIPTMPVYGMTPIFQCPQNNGCGCGCGAA